MMPHNYSWSCFFSSEYLFEDWWLFFSSLGDSPNPPKEDTPTGSLDSLSSPSPMAAAVHGLPGPDRDHLLTDGGGFVDWASIA